MSIVLAVLITLAICVVSAILEGLMAGGNVKQYFARLQQPRYAVSLKAWYAIGALYYVVCGVVLYRMLRHPENTDIRIIAFALIVAMMSANAVWNYIFFRARNLFISFLAFGPYIVVTLSLIFALSRFDQIAASLICLYLLYLVYAITWSYRLWNLNRANH
jgi:translocator protein